MYFSCFHLLFSAFERLCDRQSWVQPGFLVQEAILAKLKDEIGDLRNESTTAIFLMAKINFFYSENGKN